MSVILLKSELRKLGSKKRAKISQNFFKTGPGEYGEGDVFLGIRVPVLRERAKDYLSLGFRDLTQLLRSPIHEERHVALFILVAKYEKGSDRERKKFYDFYVRNARRVDNWDLVDGSAPDIVGHYLLLRSKKQLYSFARSENLWERRISIVSTYHFIKNHRFNDTLRISKVLLNDGEDLIHKAVGWMLREVGNRDIATEEKFLKKHYHRMPRTMLRYATERFPEKKRKAFLKGAV